MFLLLNLLFFSFINPIIMIARFVGLHKKGEHMVFHYVSYIKILCVAKYLFYSTMTLISSETWRETSITSLASILFIKSELPCRVLCALGVILKFSETLKHEQTGLKCLRCRKHVFEELWRENFFYDTFSNFSFLRGGTKFFKRSFQENIG